eukprot:Rhum_TRINITY_DN11567_c0_g1::Rhum_TRINITY_DN11567_c0_g1_i1::g.45383::m.45383
MTDCTSGFGVVGYGGVPGVTYFLGETVAGVSVDHLAEHDASAQDGETAPAAAAAATDGGSTGGQTIDKMSAYFLAAPIVLPRYRAQGTVAIAHPEAPLKRSLDSLAALVARSNDDLAEWRTDVEGRVVAAFLRQHYQRALTHDIVHALLHRMLCVAQTSLQWQHGAATAAAAASPPDTVRLVEAADETLMPNPEDVSLASKKGLHLASLLLHRRALLGGDHSMQIAALPSGMLEECRLEAAEQATPPSSPFALVAATPASLTESVEDSFVWLRSASGASLDSAGGDDEAEEEDEEIDP